MANGTASEDTLALLHKKLAEVMMDSLNSFERIEAITDELEQVLATGTDVNRDEVVRLILKLPTVSPALLAVIAKFLKDNNVTCNADESDEMQSLEKRLANKKRRSVGNITHLETNSEEE